MKQYKLCEKLLSDEKQELATLTLLSLATEVDWTNEEFETILRLAKGRSQTFGSIIVKRIV